MLTVSSDARLANIFQSRHQQLVRNNKNVHNELNVLAAFDSLTLVRVQEVDYGWHDVTWDEYTCVGCSCSGNTKLWNEDKRAIGILSASEVEASTQPLASMLRKYSRLATNTHRCACKVITQRWSSVRRRCQRFLPWEFCHLDTWAQYRVNARSCSVWNTTTVLATYIEVILLLYHLKTQHRIKNTRSVYWVLKIGLKLLS